MSSVSQLGYAWRGGSKTRNYSVLTFRALGERYDVLEDIPKDDAIRVLRECKNLGFDVVFPEVFLNHDGPMNSDIQQRGWFVNPWRPDDAGTHPKEQL